MKLRLKGAKGTKAGPALTWDGLDEIEIDFTGKQGLISISGENGTGKTVCLESLSHFPQFVSRDGALWQGFMGREAEKEFESDFMGHQYRSLIKMDADQGKQEGYLWIDGKPSVNGKITAYKEMVNSIFGQPFTYFRSQFCPQKSKKTREMQIENMTANVFRELLREFLNLQKYAGYEDTAKQAGNHYQAQVTSVDARIHGLESLIAEWSNLPELMVIAQDNVTESAGKMNALKQQIIAKRLSVDTLKATIQKNALAIQRKADLQGQIDRLEGALAKEKAVAQLEIDGLSGKWLGIREAINKAGAILKEKDAIERSVNRVRELEAGTVGLVAGIEELQSDYPVQQKRCHDLETKLAQLRQQAKDLENDPRLRAIADEGLANDHLIVLQVGILKEADETSDSIVIGLLAQIKTAKEKISALEKKGRLCPDDPTCQFIVSALAAKEELPALMATMQHRREMLESVRLEEQAVLDRLLLGKTEHGMEAKSRKEEIDVKRTALNDQIRTITHDLKNAQQVLLSTNELLAMHRGELTRKREEIAKQKALADRLPDIRIAEERERDLEKQLAEVTAQGTARKKAWTEKEKSSGQLILIIQDDMLKLVIDHLADESLTMIQAEITDLETVRILAVETEIQTARDRIATLQAELTRIEQAEKELAHVRDQRDLLTRNMSSWRYLQFGCGKTGLQNLRIDGAAPRIVYNANRLLSQAYGALYSIRLETINEAGKEDLQVKIIMENGQEVYLDDISGGQRTWCVQALWLAMSLLNQEKSGKRFTYFCADENDGALDPENAEKFTALYRPFMGLAKLEQVIYISHKPSCRAMADHVLTFQHGKNPRWG